MLIRLVRIRANVYRDIEEWINLIASNWTNVVRESIIAMRMPNVLIRKEVTIAYVKTVTRATVTIVDVSISHIIIIINILYVFES